MAQKTPVTLRQLKTNLQKASPRTKQEFNRLALRHNQRNVVVRGTDGLGGGVKVIKRKESKPSRDTQEYKKLERVQTARRAQLNAMSSSWFKYQQVKNNYNLHLYDSFDELSNAMRGSIPLTISEMEDAINKDRLGLVQDTPKNRDYIARKKLVGYPQNLVSLWKVPPNNGTSIEEMLQAARDKIAKNNTNEHTPNQHSLSEQEQQDLKAFHKIYTKYNKQTTGGCTIS